MFFIWFGSIQSYSQILWARFWRKLLVFNSDFKGLVCMVGIQVENSAYSFGFIHFLIPFVEEIIYNIHHLRCFFLYSFKIS